jgi:hypothetical protein
MLVTVTAWMDDLPITVGSKTTASGTASRCGPETCPTPLRLKEKVPALVVATSAAAWMPVAVGWKVTMLESVSPGARVEGSGGITPLAMNSGLLDEKRGDAHALGRGELEGGCGLAAHVHGPKSTGDRQARWARCCRSR